MKKYLSFLILTFLISIPLGFAAEAGEKGSQKEVRAVYTDKGAPENAYHLSQFIGDVEDLEFDEGCAENARVGETCVRFNYKAAGNHGWVGAYWVNPPANWGDERGGYDLREAKKLTFWARGEKGGEHIAVFRFGGFKGLFSDTDIHGIGPVVLTPEWRQYVIDLDCRNMRYISAGFGFCVSKNYNRQGCVFYVDDIKYE